MQNLSQFFSFSSGNFRAGVWSGKVSARNFWVWEGRVWEVRAELGLGMRYYVQNPSFLGVWGQGLEVQNICSNFVSSHHFDW